MCTCCMKDAEVTADHMGKFMELAEPDKIAGPIVRAKRASSADTLALREGKAGPEVCHVWSSLSGHPGQCRDGSHGLAQVALPPEMEKVVKSLRQALKAGGSPDRTPLGYERGAQMAKDSGSGCLMAGS